MSYIIKIEDTDKMAKSIINMLKQLAKDYTFLNIQKIEEDVDENIAKELESRYQYVSENPEDGKSWEEVKRKLLGK